MPFVIWIRVCLSRLCNKCWNVLFYRVHHSSTVPLEQIMVKCLARGHIDRFLSLSARVFEPATLRLLVQHDAYSNCGHLRLEQIEHRPQSVNLGQADLKFSLHFQEMRWLAQIICASFMRDYDYPTWLSESIFAFHRLYSKLWIAEELEHWHVEVRALIILSKDTRTRLLTACDDGRTNNGFQKPQPLRTRQVSILKTQPCDRSKLQCSLFLGRYPSCL